MVHFWRKPEGRRLFHAQVAATGKAWSPSVEWSVDNTTSVAVSAERRRRQDCQCQTSGDEAKAAPISQQGIRRRHAMKAVIKASTHSRNLIRYGTFNQWSSRTRSNGVVFGPPCWVNQAGSRIQNGLQPVLATVLQMARNTSKNRVAVVNLVDNEGTNQVSKAWRFDSCS